MIKPGVLLFDVNETLIDLAPLKVAVNELLKSAEGFRYWFGLLLHASMVENTIGQYHDFTFLALASLEMATRSFQISAPEARLKGILELMNELKAYPDVAPALELFRGKGFRLATLTNSTYSVLNRQLENSGLLSVFEKAFSIDTIRLYKPAPKTYKWACYELSAKPEDTMMIAAHAWDLAGAAAAGLRTCFVQREGQFLNPAYAVPDFMGNDLLEIARQF